MKKVYLFLCGLIFAMLCLVACSGGDEPTIVTTSVTLSATELSLTVGSSQTLIATVSPDNVTNKSVIWQSSNSSVATISSNGVVMGIGVGVAIITAIYGDKSASCVVTVEQEVGGVDASIDPWGETDNYGGTVN